MKAFEFGKSHKITLKRDVERIFGKTQTARSGMILLKYTFREKMEGDPAVKVLVVVAKRRVKKAVDRNRIKRQIREAYRLNKPAFSGKLTYPWPHFASRNYIQRGRQGKLYNT